MIFMVIYQARFQQAEDKEWFFGSIALDSTGTGLDHHYDPKAGGNTLDECREALIQEFRRYLGDIKGSNRYSIPTPLEQGYKQLNIPFEDVSEQPNIVVENIEIDLDSIQPNKYKRTRGR